MSKGQIAWHVRLWPGTWPAASNGTKVVLGRLPQPKRHSCVFAEPTRPKNFLKWKESVFARRLGLLAAIRRFRCFAKNFRKNDQNAPISGKFSPRKPTKVPRKVHGSPQGPRKVHERSKKGSTKGPRFGPKLTGFRRKQGQVDAQPALRHLFRAFGR